jgi:hypothetical protein
MFLIKKFFLTYNNMQCARLCEVKYFYGGSKKKTERDNAVKKENVSTVSSPHK